MWLFMLLCYLLMGGAFLLLGITGLAGYLSPTLMMGMHHSKWALFTVVIYLAGQTLVMFFFVGTGVSIKEHIQEVKGDPNPYKRCISLKRKIYPPLLWNLLLVSCLFILGGAVHTRSFPGWIHGLLFWLAWLHLGKVLGLLRQCFSENNQIMIDTFAAPLEKRKGQAQSPSDGNQSMERKKSKKLIAKS